MTTDDIAHSAVYAGDLGLTFVGPAGDGYVNPTRDFRNAWHDLFTAARRAGVTITVPGIPESHESWYEGWRFAKAAAVNVCAAHALIHEANSDHAQVRAAKACGASIAGMEAE